MSTAVEAIYEGGLLRLLEPLPFAAPARVRVSVESLPEIPSETAHRFVSADLAGSYELEELPATNTRAREKLPQRREYPV